MTTARIAFVAVLLALGYSWLSPSLAQAPPSSAVPGQPGLRPPSIPGMPSGVPGFQPPAGTGGTAGTAAQMPKGQDAQWTGKRCLNRGGNSMGTCQDVCRNLGVTSASGTTEYSGICNY